MSHLVWLCLLEIKRKDWHLDQREWEKKSTSVHIKAFKSRKRVRVYTKKLAKVASFCIWVYLSFLSWIKCRRQFPNEEDIFFTNVKLFAKWENCLWSVFAVVGSSVLKMIRFQLIFIKIMIFDFFVRLRTIRLLSDRSPRRLFDIRGLSGLFATTTKVCKTLMLNFGYMIASSGFGVQIP